MPGKFIGGHDTGGASLGNSLPQGRRRPVCIEVPVTVQGVTDKELRVGLDRGEPFCEEARTVIVFAQGAVVRLAAGAEPGQRVVLTNKWMNKEVLCRVVQSKTYAHVKGYVELEFAQPLPNFWGIQFPREAAPAPEPPGVMRPDPATMDAPAASAAAAAAGATPAAPPPVVTLADSIRESAARSRDAWVAAPFTAEEPMAVPAFSPAELPSTQVISTVEATLPIARPQRRRGLFLAVALTVVIGVVVAGFAFDPLDRGATSADHSTAQTIPPGAPADVVSPDPRTWNPSSASIAILPQGSAPNRGAMTIAPPLPAGEASGATGAAPSAQPEQLATPIKMPPPRFIPSLEIKPVRKPEIVGVPPAAPGVIPAPEVSGAAPGVSLAGSSAISTGLKAEPPPPPPAPKPATKKAPTSSLKVPKLVTSVPPVYPALARRNRVEGNVVIEAMVDPTGKISQAKVLSGPILLHQSALDAVHLWRYEPAQLSGKAVEFKLNITLQFRLSQ